ncbi:ORF26 [White sturgeon adenovirus 1]|uniref:ORF26 n=1 Tax=White sturgeon adenovirus 1 TaxID=2580388 RepID=A0A4P8PIQ4_9ADEN|nr:ORF26 [White sturgeon adenovirus 1]QCQ84168.1 ORF26 [White sturgeon adenovirus 1]
MSTLQNYFKKCGFDPLVVATLMNDWFKGLKGPHALWISGDQESLDHIEQAFVDLLKTRYSRFSVDYIKYPKSYRATPMSRLAIWRAACINKHSAPRLKKRFVRLLPILCLNGVFNPDIRADFVKKGLLTVIECPVDVTCAEISETELFNFMQRN